MLEDLKEHVYKANLELVQLGLVVLPGETPVQSTEGRDWLSLNPAASIMIK